MTKSKRESRYDAVKRMTDAFRDMDPEGFAKIEATVRRNVERAVQAGAFTTKH